MGEKILVLDIDRDRRKRVESLCDIAGYEAMAVEDEFSLFQALKEERDFVAVLVREGLVDETSNLDILQGIKAISPEVPVVVSATSWTPESLQYCTSVGAFFCIESGAEGDLLAEVLKKAVKGYNELSSKKESA